MSEPLYIKRVWPYVILFFIVAAIALPFLSTQVLAQGTYTCVFSEGVCRVGVDACTGPNFPGSCSGDTVGECIGSGGSCTQTTQLVSRTTNLYNTALAFGAILALGVIVYGGVRYSASAGNPSGIGEAKKWVTAGLLGLLLLFSSFLILNTINPALTEPEDPLLPRQESEDPDLIDVGDDDFSIFNDDDPDPDEFDITQAEYNNLRGGCFAGDKIVTSGGDKFLQCDFATSIEAEVWCIECDGFGGVGVSNDGPLSCTPDSVPPPPAAARACGILDPAI